MLCPLHSRTRGLNGSTDRHPHRQPTRRVCDPERIDSLVWARPLAPKAVPPPGPRPWFNPHGPRPLDAAFIGCTRPHVLLSPVSAPTEMSTSGPAALTWPGGVNQPFAPAGAFYPYNELNLNHAIDQGQYAGPAHLVFVLDRNTSFGRGSPAGRDPLPEQARRRWWITVPTKGSNLGSAKAFPTPAPGPVDGPKVDSGRPTKEGSQGIPATFVHERIREAVGLGIRRHWTMD